MNEDWKWPGHLLVGRTRRSLTQPFAQATPKLAYRVTLMNQKGVSVLSSLDSELQVT